MKKLLLLSLNLFVCMLAMGEPVSSKQALEIASGYRRNKQDALIKGILIF